MIEGLRIIRSRACSTGTAGRNLNAVREHHLVLNGSVHTGGPEEKITPRHPSSAEMSARVPFFVKTLSRQADVALLPGRGPHPEPPQGWQQVALPTGEILIKGARPSPGQTNALGRFLEVNRSPHWTVAEGIDFQAKTVARWVGKTLEG